MKNGKPPIKTGRQKFRSVAPALRLIASFLGLLPRGLVEKSWWIVEWMPGMVGIGLRYAFALRLCRSCGDNVQFGPGVCVQCWENLSIGSNVNIHRQCYVDAWGGLRIHDNVSIAHASSIVAFGHTWADERVPIKYNPLVDLPIEIGPDVWIGCGVRVLGGASIGERSIVAAGAVVTKGQYAGGIFAGVPARCISGFDPCESRKETTTSQ